MPATSAPRIGGASRYDTAALLADEFVAVTGKNPASVIVASGEDAKQGIDALSAAFLAGVLGAPVLLTAQDGLPAATADALARLAPGDVRVMGGPGVVSDAVMSAIAAIGGGVSRVSRVNGSDRYDTAARAARLGASAIGSYTLVAGEGSRPTALLASGTNPADGLSAGPLAYAGKVPLLLTSRDELPGPTRTALAELGITQVVALGGRAAISARVLDGLEAAGVVTLTVPGGSRFDTAAILLALASCPQLTGAEGAGALGGFGLPFADAGAAYLANGERFPDALAAGAVAGAALRPLFLTSANSLPGETAGVIAATGARSMTAVGLSGAVSDAVLAAA